MIKGSPEEGREFEKLETVDGKVFYAAKVKKVTGEEIRIVHRDGAAGVKLANLPEELQGEFGYEPLEAAIAADERRATEKARMAQLAERIRRERRVNAENVEKAKPTASAKVERKRFFVREVLENGLLVEEAGMEARRSGLGSIGGGGRPLPPEWRPSGNWGILQKYPKAGEVVDGDFLDVEARRSGRYLHEQALERTKTVPVWEWVRTPKN